MRRKQTHWVSGSPCLSFITSITLRALSTTTTEKHQTVVCGIQKKHLNFSKNHWHFQRYDWNMKVKHEQLSLCSVYCLMSGLPQVLDALWTPALQEVLFDPGNIRDCEVYQINFSNRYQVWIYAITSSKCVMCNLKCAIFFLFEYTFLVHSAMVTLKSPFIKFMLHSRNETWLTFKMMSGQFLWQKWLHLAELVRTAVIQQRFLISH